MSISSGPKPCPKCGAPIPAEAPQGLCPKCLLSQASIPTEGGEGAIPKSPAPSRDEVAAAFPQLEILELIGQGGMGFVFKARQPKIERHVALKILPQSLAADPAFAERFTREGRVLARLNHPNIVTIHDFGQANGFFYILMEFVDGVNLRQAMRAGRFTPAQALEVVPKICEALQFAHNEGILHRDIKPENILLDAKGRVKIADFGIAKLAGTDAGRAGSPLSAAGAPPVARAAETTLTETGKVFGTPNYMAPEQLEKPNEVDHRADIYSLGVVFYEMLTGELPLGKFQPPSEKVRVDVRLDEVVLHALEKEPARRYQQVSEVKTAVDTIASAPPSRKPEPAAQPAPAPDRFWRHFAIAGALGVLAMILIPVAAILLAIILPAYQKAHARATAVRQQIEASSTPVQVLGTGTDQAGLLPEVPSSGPFTKTVLLTRATNQLINASENVRTMSVWTDSTLNPSETIAAFVKRGDGTVSPANSLCFVHWQPDHVSTSVSLSWYFGGSLGKGLGQAEAEAAAAQVRDNLSDRPLTLISGKPLELFSVTNASGSAIIGYIEFNRSVPKPPEGSEGAAAKPQATVNIRRFAAYSPSIDYSVKLPAGYALRATANIGQASTHFSQSPKPGDYHSSWHRPPSLRHTADYLDFPAQLSAQQSALETRFQELQDLGPIPVVLGEPYLVFSFTNKANEVFRGYFELIGFPAAGHATNAALNTETRNLQAVNSIPTKGPQTGLTNIRVGAPSAAPRAGFSPGGSLLPAGLPAKGQVDPATGLPIGLPSGTSARINPATGLPAHEDAQAGTHP